MILLYNTYLYLSNVLIMILENKLTFIGLPQPPDRLVPYQVRPILCFLFDVESKNKRRRTEAPVPRIAAVNRL